MKYVKEKSKNWDEKEGYSKRIYLTEKDLDISGALVQQIKIKTGEVAKEHYHKIQTEIFYFLNNNGYWIVNDIKIVPGKGDVMVIEPNDRHEVVNDTKEDYLYVAFKYNYRLEDNYTK